MCDYCFASGFLTLLYIRNSPLAVPHPLGQVGVAVGGCFVFVLLLPELFCCGRYVLYAETKVLLTICLNLGAKLIQNVVIQNKNQSK